MNQPTKTALLAAASGVLFGIGLSLSGMADPMRVLGFLRPGADWDPTLAFVMIGALSVTAPGMALVAQRGRTWQGNALPAQDRNPVDRRLLLGASLFGLGWGLSGYCPGPALVAGAWGAESALILLIGLLAGGWLVGRLPQNPGK